MFAIILYGLFFYIIVIKRITTYYVGMYLFVLVNFLLLLIYRKCLSTDLEQVVGL